MEYLGCFAGRPFTIPEGAAARKGRYLMIIETKRDPLLPLVISNFAVLMCPLGWRLIIVHGTADTRQWLSSHPDFRPTNPSEIVWMQRLDVGKEDHLLLGSDILLFHTQSLLLRPERLDSAFSAKCCRHDRNWNGPTRDHHPRVEMISPNRVVECDQCDDADDESPWFVEYCTPDMSELIRSHTLAYILGAHTHTPPPSPDE